MKTILLVDDDPQLRSLWLLEHLSGASGKYQQEFSNVFRNVKREKVKFLASTTELIGELMDRCCRYYVETLFDERSKLKTPVNIVNDLPDRSDPDSRH